MCKKKKKETAALLSSSSARLTGFSSLWTQVAYNMSIIKHCHKQIHMPLISRSAKCILWFSIVMVTMNKKRWELNIHLKTKNVWWGGDRWSCKWSRNNRNRSPFIVCLSSSIMNDEDGIANGSVNEWTLLSLSTVFLFQCSIPFQCFWWLNDSMLMLATVKKKKKGWDFFIYIYIWRWGLWVIQNEWKISVLVFTGAGRLYGGDMFECQNEIKTELQNVGLEIPAEWAWFLCKNP